LLCGVDISITLSLKMASGLRDPGARRLRMRTRLSPVKVGNVANSIFLRPRIFGRLGSPMSFAQPKDSSTSLRALMLRAYPA